jgi:hypothetical protein
MPQLQNSRILFTSLFSVQTESGYAPYQLDADGKRKGQATDPRDKIDALLCVAERSGCAGIPVDYQASVENVHISTASCLIIKNRRDLNITSERGMRPYPIINNYMPI